MYSVDTRNNVMGRSWSSIEGHDYYRIWSFLAIQFQGPRGLDDLQLAQVPQRHHPMHRIHAPYRVSCTSTRSFNPSIAIFNVFSLDSPIRGLAGRPTSTLLTSQSDPEETASTAGNAMTPYNDERQSWNGTVPTRGMSSSEDDQLPSHVSIKNKPLEGSVLRSTPLPRDKEPNKQNQETRDCREGRMQFRRLLKDSAIRFMRRPENKEPSKRELELLAHREMSSQIRRRKKEILDGVVIRNSSPATTSLVGTLPQQNIQMQKRSESSEDSFSKAHPTNEAVLAEKATQNMNFFRERAQESNNQIRKIRRRSITSSYLAKELNSIRKVRSPLVVRAHFAKGIEGRIYRVFRSLRTRRVRTPPLSTRGASLARTANFIKEQKDTGLLFSRYLKQTREASESMEESDGQQQQEARVPSQNIQINDDRTQSSSGLDTFTKESLSLYLMDGSTQNASTHPMYKEENEIDVDENPQVIYRPIFQVQDQQALDEVPNTVDPPGFRVQDEYALDKVPEASHDPIYVEQNEASSDEPRREMYQDRDGRDLDDTSEPPMHGTRPAFTPTRPLSQAIDLPVQKLSLQCDGDVQKQTADPGCMDVRDSGALQELNSEKNRYYVRHALKPAVRHLNGKQTQLEYVQSKEEPHNVDVPADTTTDSKHTEQNVATEDHEGVSVPFTDKSGALDPAIFWMSKVPAPRLGSRP